MIETLPSRSAADTEWFLQSRFGLFIHWGLYAVPARHEWVQSRELIAEDDYRRYFETFDPDLYDPETWAREAYAAGMRYAVITTKHHDGFCLWDSALTDYKAPNTPAGRDLLRPFVDAFRAAGMRIGFYHSLIDWHHPEFPVDGIHPMRDDEEFKARAKGRDISVYREYLHGQVRELLTQYGKIDVMWYDFSYSGRWWGGKGKEDWGSEELLAMTRELQPGVIVNDRLEIGGDLVTPEQYQPARAPARADGEPVLWEACQTLNGSWGYDRDNLDWKSLEMLVQMLVDTVSKGGNLLLNVGPTARGEFDPRAMERLRGVGEWMRLHERAIRGCGPSLHVPPPDCRYTQRGDRLYLHVFAWPFRHLHLEGMADRVRWARLLGDGSEIAMTVIDPAQEGQNTTMAGMPPGTLTLELPIQRPPGVVVPVIELGLASSG
ncbi:MAG TPA: alpha-L-fucosidase [Solirubrobacteraceae bacterium]|nr:alpha-L-fucosidase [Solirubrobacteraceae bacterium]